MTSRVRTSSEDLVPRNMPHGDRQGNVAALRQSGAPLGSRDVPQQQTLPLAENVARTGNLRPENAVRPVRQDLDVLRDFSPEELSMFAQPSAPTPQLPATLADRIEERGRQANNRFAQAVAQRMRLRNQTGA